MKILVFIKQVPETADIQFNLDTKTLVREGVRNIINPYDRRAISEAIRCRAERGGEVIVATMGPPQAREALAEALLMGANRVVHIEDARLAGSDSLVTARVLAAAARKIGFDLIFCGQHSIDSETGQVPPQIGELLGVPCATAVKKIVYGDGYVRVQCERDSGTDALELPLPAVLSAAERLIRPIKTKNLEPSPVPPENISVFRLEDLGLVSEEVGLSGSRTWVSGIFQEKTLREARVVDGSDPVAAARLILEVVRREARIPHHNPIVPPRNPRGERQFWCLMEDEGERGLTNVSLEILNNAAQLCSLQGGAVHAIVVRQALQNQDVMQLSSYGADAVWHVSAANPHPDDVVALLCERISVQKPYAFLVPATSAGRYIAGRISARLHLGLTGDCVGLAFDQEEKLVQLKPAFGGLVLASIQSKTFPQMATIRPGALPAFQPRSVWNIPVRRWDLPYNTAHQFTVVACQIDRGSEASRMNDADIVVCVGVGLGKENVALAMQLAGLMGGAIGATRKVVDSGWLERQYQVGLTGKFIAPRVYLGLGVSGRYNHTIGILKASAIVAINVDPDAEIMKIANPGIIGDCVLIAKSLIHLLEA
jgi:electron transfer flavoprotein alpha subunit